MKRRDFISLAVGAVALWPLALGAQQPAIPVVGFLSSLTPEALRSEIEGFERGLADAGFIADRTVKIEFGWAAAYDRLPAVAADLVARHVTVIMAAGNVAARSAEAATNAIPIVFHTGDDPIATGIVPSLNNPRGNVTGVSAMAGLLPTKRLELLHRLKPSTSIIGALVNPSNANADNDIASLQSGAQSIGVQLQIFKASKVSDFENVFATLSGRHVGALLVNSDSFLTSQRHELVALSERYKVPTIYSFREFVVDGGLMSYGADRVDTYRIAGTYVGRILKGEKPSDLPVQQPTKFELAINVKAAKTMGVVIPPALLVLADEVIE
jgi:putative ABC transport system substrate-binding protein